MSRTLNRLTTRQVATLKVAGRHADGGGLYLRITPAGARSWVFMTARDGKREEIGLGAASTVSLATARQLAARMRDAIAFGDRPRSVLQAAAEAAAPALPTFSEFADSYISSIEEGWKNAVHRQQWRNSLRDHANHIANIPVDQVDTENVIAVLSPIWLTKAETARRVRGRIERILDAAKARGLRSRDAMNPAAWRGHLALLLPPQGKLARGHHAALPFKDAPAFLALLTQREAMSARCLEFVILTAARSGEALGATWSEIDMEGRLWTVPAARMKAGAEHQVPLSDAAIALLKSIAPAKTNRSAKVFDVGGTVRSNMAMTMLLRRLKYGHITTHGFRSTFRDWAGDATNFPREVIEQALAHTIQNRAERAYRRGTAIERRRELMEAWGIFLSP
jgi:integrase